MMNEFNPDGKDIRFIDSHYRDLFRIPDGGTIQVHYSDDSVVSILQSRPVKMVMTIRSLIKNFMRLMAVSWTIQSCLCWKHELKFWLDLDFR